MPAVQKRIARVAVILSAAMISPALLADEAECGAPAEPQFPAEIDSEAHADSLSVIVDSTISEGVAYLTCMNNALENGRDDMTDKERQRLETAIAEHVAKMRALANQWNGMYSSHVSKKLRDR